MEVLMRNPLTLILTLVVIAPGSVAAQNGFWLSVGGGTARNRVDCETCEEINRYWGVSGFVRAGGDVSPHIKVGGELHFWQASIQDTDAYVRGLQAVVNWYPSAAGGFFGQVGLGLSRIRSSFDVGDEIVRAAEIGLNVSAGVGWDIPLSKDKGMYLTPRIASAVVPVATIDTPAGPLDNVVSTLYRFELGLTFR
jgi:hypothetical protein